MVSLNENIKGFLLHLPCTKLLGVLFVTTARRHLYVLNNNSIYLINLYQNYTRLNRIHSIKLFATIKYFEFHEFR